MQRLVTGGSMKEQVGAGADRGPVSMMAAGAGSWMRCHPLASTLRLVASMVDVVARPVLRSGAVQTVAGKRTTMRRGGVVHPTGPTTSPWCTEETALNFPVSGLLPNGIPPRQRLNGHRADVACAAAELAVG